MKAAFRSCFWVSLIFRKDFQKLGVFQESIKFIFSLTQILEYLEYFTTTLKC